MGLSLDIDLLRSFVMVAQTRALSRAAAHIGRTQSALSMQMQRLEQVLDQPLLQRTGRGVLLTPQGERLLVHAQRILRCHDEALADLTGKGLSGTIRFGCPDDYAAVFLPHLLRGFAREHPQVLVEVICAPTPRLLERIEGHAVDLALISLADADATDVIRREPLVWVGCSGTDAAAFEPLPLALSHLDTLDHVAARQSLDSVGRAYRIAYASSSLAGLTALVRSGQAIAVLTQTAVPADLQIVPASAGLPPLPAVGISLRFDREQPSSLVAAFALHIRQQLPAL